jgi:hypothetical protein
MKFSLFIDESGDFHQSKEWIVSGLLCPFDKNIAEKNLKKTLGYIPRQIGISSNKKMHMTELRQKRGHDSAVEAAKTLFSGLCNSNYKWKLVVARNHTKFGLSDPERTYRLMLLDLIALAESTIPENIKLSGFDIVIATRTNKDSGERMTTLVDLNQDVVARISDALEAGIASRGMIDFLDSKGLDITTLQANKSWGLIVADFICNISYNHRYSSEASLLEKLKNLDILYEFQSFGGYQERRARIAERDGNFIEAIRRWAYIQYLSPEDKNQQTEILVQLFDKVITFGTAGPSSTIEAIIEHIWRDETLKGKFAEVYKILGRLEVALDASCQKCALPQITSLLFRLNNFMHLVVNKIGDTQKAQFLIKKKQQLKSKIELSPEFLPLILDSQLYEIDTKENALLLSDCLDLAISHHALVQLYKECWDLLVEGQSTEGFSASRIYIKSEMTLVRSQILVGLSKEIENALIRIASLKQIPLNPVDKRRLLNYEILAYVKIKNFVKSIELGFKALKFEPDKFLVQHVLRAVVSSLLTDNIKYKTDGEKLLSFMSSYNISESGHPIELIWRDWGLLDFLITGKKSVVLRYLKRSKKYLLNMPENTPIIKWLNDLNDMHVDFVKGKTLDIKNTETLKQLIIQSEIEILPSNMDFPQNSKTLLILLRHVSPY